MGVPAAEHPSDGGTTILCEDGYQSDYLESKVSPVEIRQKITSAFERSANIDANAIDISVEGSKVVLKGKVRSFSERESAEGAAWLAPGVLSVLNELEVEPQE